MPVTYSEYYWGLRELQDERQELQAQGTQNKRYCTDAALQLRTNHCVKKTMKLKKTTIFI